MEFKDYYDILGVSKKVTQNEIQKAYRKLAKKYHPDTSKEVGAEAKFKEIGEAYDVLKDTDKRAKYDKYGAAWKAAGHGHQASPHSDGIRFEFGGSGGGQDGTFFDILEHMFGNGAMGNGFGGHRGRAIKGENVEARLPLTLEDAFRGGKQTVTLNDPQTGQQKSYTVTIPAGVKTGRRIRLAGQGRPSRSGAEAGDLYLVVDLIKHPKFEMKGNHLYTTLDVLPHLAVLGGKVGLDTLQGQVRVTIPAGSNSGQKIRLKERGLGSDSDLYAEIRIVVPECLTPEERELYEQLAKASEAVVM